MPSSLSAPDISDLPGEELIRDGLRDLADGKTSIGSLLVSIARTRLLRDGLPIEGELNLDEDAELCLYRLLGETGEDGDPYAQYNSLIRLLCSFANALTYRARKQSQG